MLDSSHKLTYSSSSVKNQIKADSALMPDLLHGDALRVLPTLLSNSVHLVITDPPYFIDGMGKDWDSKKLEVKASKAGVIGSLPVGMKFDPVQGRHFQEFMERISSELFRILKPGGFFICFSQPRLYHRMAVAAEDAGFEIRDMMTWLYSGQTKAFSQDHFVRKMKISEREKKRIIAELGGRKTPQLRPRFETMILGQKPKDGTFVDNWLAHKTGLMDASQLWDDKFPSNAIECPKPKAEEKGADNHHLTVKPVRLIEHLISLFSTEGQIVLDPFLGSGTHAIAALRTNRKSIGIEIDKSYFDLSTRRVKAEFKATKD
jgi:site-specific DNA-methyltransferase (adenine-specific)